MIYIDKETRLRVNVRAPYKGFSVLDTPEIRERAGIVEVPAPAKPEDYSEDAYIVQDIDEAPYVVYSPRDPAEVAKARLAKVAAQRAYAYREEADPLFFKVGRGEAKHEEWLAKIAEIKERYPKE